uniref:Uncharacterized protein n=1 Tax=Salmo trutta TaxID=8032 RepID=A0A674CS05_SALTR
MDEVSLLVIVVDANLICNALLVMTRTNKLAIIASHCQER